MVPVRRRLMNGCIMSGASWSMLHDNVKLKKVQTTQLIPQIIYPSCQDERSAPRVLLCDGGPRRFELKTFGGQSLARQLTAASCRN